MRMKRTPENVDALRRRIESSAALQDDANALESVWMYPDYVDLVQAQTFVATLHYRFRYNGELWRTEQPTHTFDGTYYPGQPGTESLYSRVTLPSEGETPDSPIAYNRNMELFKGKYYSDDGVTYLCIRDSGVPLYHPLAQLVQLYVEVYA